MSASETRAMELYPPQDGGQPGVDRNVEARHAYVRGWKDRGTLPDDIQAPTIDLRTTDSREQFCHGSTGVYIRAIGQDGRWGTYDIAELDRDSLVAFVRSRGSVSTFALHLVLIWLGYDREGVE